MTVPPNGSAEVTLWDAEIRRIREGGRPLSDAPGVRAVRQDGRDVTLTIGSGDYAFTVTRSP